MLRERLQSGLLLGAALLAAAFFLPPSGALVMLLLICLLAMLEFYALLDRSKIPHFKVVGIVSGLAVVAATWLSEESQARGACDYSEIALFGAAAAVFLRQLGHRSGERAWETMGGTLLGIVYVAFLFNFFTRLLTEWGNWEGRFLIIYLVVVVKFNDIGAYFVGCAFGRHKLIPRISPAKSWEGLFGGLVASVAASAVVYLITNQQRGAISMTLADALACGLLLGAAGVIGDLVESTLKRAAGVKDSGSLILGMGGILDVLDSLLFAAPVLYAYASWFMTA
jgi:phosphatidate cytidylyltransferase